MNQSSNRSVSEVMKWLIFTVLGVIMGLVCFLDITGFVKIIMITGFLDFSVLFLVAEIRLEKMGRERNRNESNETNKRAAAVRMPEKEIVLFDEQGRRQKSWSLEQSDSLLIGKGTENNPVDIDLSGSASAQIISKHHAMLNETDRGWFMEDLNSKNGTRVKKRTQNAIMDLKRVGAVRVEAGDIIFIAGTKLQIR